MSKQSEAKAAQNYAEKGQSCSSCQHFKSTRVLPHWMSEENMKQPPTSARYTLASHGIETMLRCGIGGFSVKRLGRCDKFEAKNDCR